MKAQIYTDASYRSDLDISACGFVVFIDKEIIKHSVTLVSGLGGSGNAEVYSMVEALEFTYLIKEVSHIILKTDHQGTVLTRKHKRVTEPWKTISKIKKHGVIVEVFYVKAHSKCDGNRLIDKSCRKELKKHLKLSKSI